MVIHPCPKCGAVMLTDGKRVGFLGLVGYSCPICPPPSNKPFYIVMGITGLAMAILVFAGCHQW